MDSSVRGNRISSETFDGQLEPHAKQVPSVGCPAKSSSVAGVKMRFLYIPFLPSISKGRVISDKLNSVGVGGGGNMKPVCQLEEHNARAVGLVCVPSHSRLPRAAHCSVVRS